MHQLSEGEQDAGDDGAGDGDAAAKTMTMARIARSLPPTMRATALVLAVLVQVLHMLTAMR